jgi:hypothetical protein
MEKGARGASENAESAFPAFPQPRLLLAEFNWLPVQGLRGHLCRRVGVVLHGLLH